MLYYNNRKMEKCEKELQLKIVHQVSQILLITLVTNVILQTNITLVTNVKNIHHQFIFVVIKTY